MPIRPLERVLWFLAICFGLGVQSIGSQVDDVDSFHWFRGIVNLSQTPNERCLPAHGVAELSIVFTAHCPVTAT